MKRTLFLIMLGAAVTLSALVIVPHSHAQADKVKEKAKDLKKQVEGNQRPATNAPPAKPKTK